MEDQKPNTSVKHNPITTILGIILMTMGCSFGICIWIVPIFYVVKTDIIKYWWVEFMPFAVIAFGLIALFSPDKIVAAGEDCLDAAKDKIKK